MRFPWGKQRGIKVKSPPRALDEAILEATSGRSSESQNFESFRSAKDFASLQKIPIERVEREKIDRSYLM